MQHALKIIPASRHIEEPSIAKSLSGDKWATLWSPLLELQAVHAREQKGGNTWNLAFETELVAAVQYATGYQLFRRRRRHIARSGDLVVVHRLQSGSVSMEFEHRNFVLRPGTIAITDFGQQFRGSHHEAVGDMLILPRAVLGMPEDLPFAPILLSDESPRGELIGLEIERLFDAHTSPSQEPTLEPNAFVHLIRSSVHRECYPSSDRAGWWRGRNELIRGFIEQNLHDLDLLPARICNMFNLSRATLYRMFEDDGGVRRYIQDRRLHAAVWDLAVGGMRRGRLTEVAETWGFSSNANFNRAVKVVFGMPPGVLLRNLLPEMPFEGSRAISDSLTGWLEGSKTKSLCPRALAAEAK